MDIGRVFPRYESSRDYATESWNGRIPFDNTDTKKAFLVCELADAVWKANHRRRICCKTRKSKVFLHSNAVSVCDSPNAKSVWTFVSSLDRQIWRRRLRRERRFYAVWERRGKRRIDRKRHKLPVSYCRYPYCCSLCRQLYTWHCSLRRWILHRFDYQRLSVILVVCCLMT